MASAVAARTAWSATSRAPQKDTWRRGALLWRARLAYSGLQHLTLAVHKACPAHSKTDRGSFRSLSPAPSQAVCSSCSRDQSSRVAPVTGLALAMLLTGLALAALVMGGAGGRLDEAAMSEASSNDVHTSQAKAAECKALDVQARSSVTGLHSAASRGDVEGIKVLLVDCEEGCL